VPQLQPLSTDSPTSSKKQLHLLLLLLLLLLLPLLPLLLVVPPPPLLVLFTDGHQQITIVSITPRHGLRRKHCSQQSYVCVTRHRGKHIRISLLLLRHADPQKTPPLCCGLTTPCFVKSSRVYLCDNGSEQSSFLQQTCDNIVCYH
jgi:hypothetical protein